MFRHNLLIVMSYWTGFKEHERKYTLNIKRVTHAANRHDVIVCSHISRNALWGCRSNRGRMVGRKEEEEWWWWGTLIPSTALWMTVVCASYRTTGEEGVEKHEEKKEWERACVGGWVFVIANPVKMNKQTMHKNHQRFNSGELHKTNDCTLGSNISKPPTTTTQQRIAESEIAWFRRTQSQLLNKQVYFMPSLCVRVNPGNLLDAHQRA